MIRIAFAIPTLDRSGAEKQLALLAAHLPRDEFEPHVITLNRGGPYEELLAERGIPVTVLGKHWRFDPVTWWRLRRALKGLSPDIVHSWLFAANTYVRLTARRRSPETSPSLRPRIVVSERCVDSWKSGWQLALDRRLISRTDWLIANSEAVAAFYEQVGYSRDRLSVIPNAVEPPPRPDLTRERLLESLGLPADAKLIAYVGRLAKQKRLSDLLWAVQVLRQADPRTHFLILGDGPDRDRLIHNARQLECAEHCHFLGHRPEAASLLHLVDVFWLGSDFEGMSNSLMEAMACGRPCVVTNIPPNRELITHGRDGYLVDVGDSAGFAQFTLKLFENPELAASLGDSARQKMSGSFGLEGMVERHADLYRRLLSRP